jgi:UDP-N-acetylglucosamine--N-acetylmuramyl-(pentapeptide) pyrophosphoryl-undecaprenol N-acetylglucosamine transferase
MIRLGIAAGGTGGHIIPALRLAKAMEASGAELVWFGRRDSLESRIAKRYGIGFEPFEPLLSGLSVKQLPKNMGKITQQVFRVRRLMKQHQITCLFSTGAYISIIPALAAKSMRLPLVIHEQNTYMGRANRLLSLLANKVCLGMPIDEGGESSVMTGKRVLVGNPVTGAVPMKEGQNILVIGGSQGSQFLNQTLPEVLRQCQVTKQVIHIAGSGAAEVEARYKQLGIEATVYGFVNDLRPIYHETKIVISRSGAMTLAEIVHHQLPSILIPYPYATQDHQKKNANHLVNASAALCVEEDAASLKKALLKLLSSEYARQSMRQSLAPLSYPRAIEDMMGLIQEEHA